MAKKDTHLTQTGAEVQKILNEAQQTYTCPLADIAEPIEGDICVPPPMLTPYPIPTEYSEDYYDIPVDSQEVIITKKTDRPVDRWSETEFTITGYTKAGIDDYGTDLDALEMTFPYTHHFHFMPGAGDAAFMTIMPRDICEYLEFSRIASVPYIYHNGEWIQYVQLSAEGKASLELNIKHALSVAEEAYHLPDGGIPSNDLSSSVRESLNKANTAYQKPYTGIPETDLSQGVRETLMKAANAQKTTFDSGPGSFPIGSVNPGDVYTIYDGVRRMDLDYFALGEDEVGYYIYVGKKAIRVYGTAYDANNKLEGMALNGQWQTIADIPQGSYSYNVSQYEMLRISNSTVEYYNATVYIEYGTGEYVYRSGIWMPMKSTEDQLHLIEKYYEWDAKYTKPANGIPASDLADGVIPDISGKADAATTLAGYGITDAYTRTEVDSKVSSAYKAAGTVASVASLGTLDAAHEGFVYNMSASFTTTSDFVEGSGTTYPAGTNVAIVNTGTVANPVYKYDVLAGFVDISGKADKSEMSVVDGTDANADKTTITLKSGTSATVLKSHQDISGKADKVASAINGDLAALDSNGNLADSGKSASDFQPTIDSSHKLAASLVSGLATVATSGSFNDLSNKPDEVEANPTVPSGTTPTALTGMKIGNGYYDIEAGGGTIDAEDYSGVAPVLVDPSNYYTKAETEELVETPVAATQPVGGFLPNVIYDLGEITGSVTFALATPTDNTIANTYVWTFETGNTAPTVAWPSNLTWLGGSAPTINTGKHYEITIRKGYANCLEF